MDPTINKAYVRPMLGLCKGIDPQVGLAAVRRFGVEEVSRPAVLQVLCRISGCPMEHGGDLNVNKEKTMMGMTHYGNMEQGNCVPFSFET